MNNLIPLIQQVLYLTSLIVALTCGNNRSNVKLTEFNIGPESQDNVPMKDDIKKEVHSPEQNITENFILSLNTEKTSRKVIWFIMNSKKQLIRKGENGGMCLK